jgi:pyruvate/2-oxoglutarate dehydrogenase complex dihydrolipoamide dehydrogenase (E3) component
LDLEAAGIPVDARSRICVNDQFQTAAPHIYASGDVIGFPSLAADGEEKTVAMDSLAAFQHGYRPPPFIQ